MSFTIFGKVVPFYGLFYFMGIGAAALVATFLIKKRKLSGYELTYSAIFAVVGGVVGAKLLYCLVSIKEVIAAIKVGDFASIMKGGFVFYGGLIGGAFGLWIYGKCFKMKMSDYYEVFATVFPLGHALGRVGCQLAGCCYGVEYSGFLSLPTWCGFYDPATMEIVYYGWGPNRLAVPVLEASVLLVLFAVLMWFYYKKPQLKLNATIYSLTYATWRFFIEFFRGDESRGKFLLSTSQWISIAIVLFVVGLLLYKKYGKKKAVAESTSETAEATESVEETETENVAEIIESVEETTNTTETVETTDIENENKTE